MTSDDRDPGRAGGALAVRGVSYLVDAAATPEEMADALSVIAGELHCNAVMLIGGDPQRLLAGAEHALGLGLATYLRPDVTDVAVDDMLGRLALVAQGAERLRSAHPDRVTLVVGSEFSHTVAGIVPGPSSFIRLGIIVRARRLVRGRIRRRLATLLTRAAVVARQHFHGPLTYSAAAWEDVDWTTFDVVGVSLYRSARNQGTYRQRVRGLVDGHDKPFVVTEFGCGAFVGADERGAASFRVVNWFSDPPRVRADVVRDESVQARYLVDLVDVYDAEGVHGCFAFTYVMPGYPRDDDPTRDLDVAGFGLVVDHEGVRVRKEAFHSLAERYAVLSRG